MAMIVCPECGKEVSESCKVCSNCGFPIKSNLNKEKCIKWVKSFKSIVDNKIFICLSLLIGLYLFYCAYDCAYSPIYMSDSLTVLYGGYDFKEPLIQTIIALIFAIAISFWGLKKLKINRILCYVIVIILLLPCPIMIGIGHNLITPNVNNGSIAKTTDADRNNSRISESIKIDKNRFATVENVQKNLDGTIWTWTEPLTKKDLEMYKFWNRFEFKNGKLYIQSAPPSKGEWGKSYEYDYTIEERRYSDTGEKYIAVKITGLQYFVPATGQYVEPYMFDFDVTFVRTMRERDYSWD